MRFVFLVLLVFGLVGAHGSAFAACTSPAGIAGEMEFDTTDGRFEYCDDTNWIAMDSSGSGSASPLTIDSGNIHSCAVGAGDKAYCWGLNTNGLGDGSSTLSTTPLEVSSGTYTQISVGERHACGVKTNGKINCWGFGGSGALGDGNLGNHSSPVEVIAGENTGAEYTRVSAGKDFTCGIGTDEKAYCWGNSYDNSPEEIVAGDNTAATYTHITVWERACGIGTDQKAYCWDDGTGDGAADVGAGDNTAETYTFITSGERHICGVGTDGKGYCWLFEDPPSEVAAGDNTAGTYTKLAVGNAHTCGIGTDEKAYCWGDGANGRLGDGNTGNHTNPVAVIAGDNTSETYTHITAGTNFTCSIGTDGKGYCWGNASDGHLGNGASSGNETSPVEVSAGDNTGGTFSTGIVSCSTTGQVYYDSTNSVMVWCDGTTLYEMGSGPGTGGCTSPTASAGAMDYNSTTDTMRFCDGTGWVNIGK